MKRCWERMKDMEDGYCYLLNILGTEGNLQKEKSRTLNVISPKRKRGEGVGRDL